MSEWLDRDIPSSKTGARPILADVYRFGLAPGQYADLCASCARARRRRGQVVILDTRQTDGRRHGGTCEDCPHSA